MPAKFKLLISILVLAVGAGVYRYEQGLGNAEPSLVAAGLAAFMVLAIWLFPEASRE